MAGMNLVIFNCFFSNFCHDFFYLKYHIAIFILCLKFFIMKNENLRFLIFCVNKQFFAWVR
jgi:hypothetical protein